MVFNPWIAPKGYSGGGGSAAAPSLTLAVANQAYATNPDLLFGWKSAAVANTLDLIESSNGVSVSSSDLWLNAAAIVTLAWATFQDASGRQWCWQRVGAGVRIKYSRSAGFVTGAAPTQTPSATDEQTIRGGGTDASPSGTNWWSLGNERFYFAFDAQGYDDAYYWNLIGIDASGSGTHRDQVGVFPVVPQDDGDPDPLMTINYNNGPYSYSFHNRDTSAWVTGTSYPPGPTTIVATEQLAVENQLYSTTDYKGPFVHWRLQRQSLGLGTGDRLQTASGFWTVAQAGRMFLLSDADFTVPGAGALSAGRDYPALALTPVT